MWNPVEIFAGKTHSAGFTRKSVGRRTGCDPSCRCRSSRVFWSNCSSPASLARSTSSSPYSVSCKTSKEHRTSYSTSRVKSVLITCGRFENQYFKRKRFPNSLMLLLSRTDLQLPPSCEVEFSVPEYYGTSMHFLLTNTANYQTGGDVVRLLAMFSFAVLKYQNTTTKLKLSGLILTGLALIILEDNIQWVVPGSNQAPLVAREQSMSNLIAIVSNSR